MKPLESAGSISYRSGDAATRSTDDRTNLFLGVWRQRWVILSAIIVGIAGAFVYLRGVAPVYASVGRLYVQRSIPRIPSDPQNSVTESSNYLYTQCEIIKSSGVISEVAKLPGVTQLPSFTGARNLAGEIQGHLHADVDGRNDLISVTYESSSPTDAAVVVNAVIDQYITFTTRQHHNSAAEVLRLLQKDKSSRDEQLAGQLERMKQFKEAHPALSFESNDRQNLVVATLARLTDALTVARLATVDATSAHEAALQRSKLHLPAGFTVADPVLKDELIRLEERRETLQSVLGENSRDVQAVDTSISRLHEQMAAQDQALTDAAVAIATQQCDAAAAKQKEIEEQVQSQEKLAVAVNSAEAEYMALEAELQRNQKISDIIDARIKELDLTEDAPPTTVAILEAAKPDLKPIAPEKSRVVATGMLLGILLGISSAWLREALSQRIGISADEVESALGVAVLGTVPHAISRDLKTCGRLVELDTHSAVAEAFRTLRAMILYGVTGDFKTLLITSACAGDGKTTAAANLAIAIAQSGQKTLLIDADLRRPSLHHIFSDSTPAGLADVILGRVKLRDVIQPTGIEGLSVLRAGAIAPNPAELVSSRRFIRILKAVSPAFDKIVIDSPPLGLVSDAQVIAATVDVTVLVIRAGRSSRKICEAAAASLASVGAKLAGVVLNDQPRQRNAGGYYSTSVTSKPAEELKARGNQPFEVPSIVPADGPSY